MNAPQQRRSTRTQAAAPAGVVKPGSSVGAVDTNDIDVGGLDKSITLTSDMSLEDLRDSLNARVSASVDTPHFREHVEELAFMEERVLIRIAPTTEKNAEVVIDVYNQGVPQRFIRGIWVICKRKYAEVLARSKPFGVTTPEFVDTNGDKSTRIDTHVGLRYPFEMRDDNPRGAAWLNGVLQED